MIEYRPVVFTSWYAEMGTFDHVYVWPQQYVIQCAYWVPS